MLPASWPSSGGSCIPLEITRGGEYLATLPLTLRALTDPGCAPGRPVALHRLLLAPGDHPGREEYPAALPPILRALMDPSCAPGASWLPSCGSCGPLEITQAGIPRRSCHRSCEP